MVMAAMTLSFMACDDDETTPDGPSITAPEISNAQVSSSADIYSSSDVLLKVNAPSAAEPEEKRQFDDALALRIELRRVRLGGLVELVTNADLVVELLADGIAPFGRRSGVLRQNGRGGIK